MPCFPETTSVLGHNLGPRSTLRRLHIRSRYVLCLDNTSKRTRTKSSILLVKLDGLICPAYFELRRSLMIPHDFCHERRDIVAIAIETYIRIAFVIGEEFEFLPANPALHNIPTS